VSWWKWSALAIISGALLAPIAIGIATTRNTGRLPAGPPRIAFLVLVVERVGIVAAFWLATFARSIWILVGVVALVLATRTCLRRLARTATPFSTDL